MTSQHHKSAKIVMESVNNEIPQQKQRFVSTSEQEKKRILTERKSKGTQQSTESKMRCFTAYLKEKNYPEEKDISNEHLPNVLLNFYSDLQRANSEIYKINSLKGMRASIN